MENPKSETPPCPNCDSKNVVFGTERGVYLCGACRHEFAVEKLVAPLRIFLSYGHDSNDKLVLRIKDELEKRGHYVWFDKKDIEPGEDWRRSITDGITGSDKVVTFLSNHSTRESSVCLDEIGIAIGVKKGNIQTVLIEGEREVKPPPCVGHFQWLDMHDWKEKCEFTKEDWGSWYRDHFAEIVRVVESDESRRFAGEIEKLQGYLNPIECDSLIYELLKKGLTGRRWILDAIEQWRAGKGPSSSESRVFWLTALPGFGKSAVAAHLAFHGPQVIAVEFCNWQQPGHRNPEQIVRTLAFQIATRLPDYRKLLLTLPDIAGLERKRGAELFDYLLADPLRHAINGKRERYVIVIDALDEAGEAGGNPLVEMLADNASRLPSWMGLVVTSRPESNVTAPLQSLNPFPFETASEENLADIRKYLRNELAPQLQKRADAELLIGQILEKSEGVFLYVERFCHDIRHGPLSLDRPEQFPQGLGGIFSQYFRRKFPDLEQFRQVQRPALQAILAARKPVPVAILQRLFHWTNEDVHDFARTLGSLFPLVNEAHGEVIKPYHKSLADWLGDQPSAESYFVDVMQGHPRLAGYCWEACAQCVEKNFPLRKNYRTYAFRFGVYHLVESQRYAQAVDLLDYLDRHHEDVPPEDRADLEQFAKHVTIAIAQHPPEAEEARRINPYKLARLLKGLYMTEPLFGGIRLLIKYHPQAWPDILTDFLKTDDYVLRHVMADALAEDFLDRASGQQERPEEICQLIEDPDLNRQELGAYALQQVYASNPKLIEPDYLNRLANGETYPFRSALGDLLLRLTLADFGTTTFAGLEIMDQVDPTSKFWNPVWDFNRMDVAWLRAIGCFLRKEELLPNPAEDALRAHEALEDTEKLRQDLLGQSEPLLRELLDNYYQLGIKPELFRHPELVCAVKKHARLHTVFEVLFSHPLWEVTEQAASLLASIVDENPSTAHYIMQLFKSKSWRAQYGAAEAAFLARFTNMNQLFEEAIKTFHRHPEPLLRGNCTENLGAWILDSSPPERAKLLRKFEGVFIHWLRNEEEDSWVLDHLYRLFNHLDREGQHADFQPLLDGGVSGLLGGDPEWYIIGRQEFLLRIEERKRAGRGLGTC